MCLLRVKKINVEDVDVPLFVCVSILFVVVLSNFKSCFVGNMSCFKADKAVKNSA